MKLSVQKNLQKGFTHAPLISNLNTGISAIRKEINTLKVNTKHSGAGFTLIELLVVIGILGILAAALVATIDPFEQLQKATDSRRQTMAISFLNSNIQYYTTQTAFPWSDADNVGENCYDNLNTGIGGLALSETDLIDCIDILAATGELKGSFDTNTNDLEQVYATWNPNDATDLVVCYAPVSKSQKSSTNTIYSAPDGETTDPVEGITCGTPDAADLPDNSCYWCTR